MDRFRNDGDQVVAFRDDAGKHFVAPGEAFSVVGPQHIAHVMTLPGIVPEDASEADGPEPEVDAGRPRSRRSQSLPADTTVTAEASTTEPAGTPAE